MPARHRTPSSRPAACAAALLAVAMLLLPLPGCQPAGPSADGPIGGPGPAAGTRPPRSPQQVVRARSLRVQDGDSFVAATGAGNRSTVRINGIDAPERYQPHADRSRRNLGELLAGRELDLHVRSTDQYGRMIAQVFIASASGESLDVGLTQIEAGMAWFFRRYQDDLPPPSRTRYAEAERRARKAGKGLWQAAEPEPPWEFRRRGRAVNRGAAR